MSVYRTIINIAKRGDIDFVGPNDGGCWFCCRQSEGMAFDGEFDTYVHIDCLKTAHDHAEKQREYDPEYMCESLIMAYLLESEAV